MHKLEKLVYLGDYQLVQYSDAPVRNFVLRKLVPGEPLLFDGIISKEYRSRGVISVLQEDLDSQYKRPIFLR